MDLSRIELIKESSLEDLQNNHYLENLIISKVFLYPVLYTNGFIKN